MRTMFADTQGLTSLLCCVAVFSVLSGQAQAQNRPVAVVDGEYAAVVRPLLARYCFECHSEDRTEADVYLSAFTTVESIRRQPTVWV